MLTKKIADKIIQAGIAAPSGDNLQPWQFHWDGANHIDVLIRDLDIDKSLFNIIYRGQKLVSLITIGTAVENMRICAEDLGYVLHTTYFPPSSEKNCVVHAEFIKDESLKNQTSAIFSSLISQRCTNRKIYNGKPIDALIKEGILEGLSPYKEINVYWIEEPQKKKRLAEFTRAADQIMFETQGLLAPLMDSIRWNKKEAERTRDGLPIETLELGWMERQSFRVFALWPLVKILNYVGLSRFASQTAQQLTNSASALGLFTLKQTDDLTNYIHGGEAFEKFWLLATSHNIALQPMVGIIFLINRVELLNGQGLPPKHIKIVRRIKEELYQLLNLPQDELPIILCRLGYATPPSVKTLRRGGNIHPTGEDTF